MVQLIIVDYILVWIKFEIELLQLYSRYREVQVGNNIDRMWRRVLCNF